MADNTAIEWTDATWNPVTGCTKVSPGCDHCYAETFAERFRGVRGHHFEKGFDLVLRPERLDQPLRWTKPKRIFVNSMSDLFHDDIPDYFIAQVFAIMALSPQHTFQLLTKRHGRMRALLNSFRFRIQVDTWEYQMAAGLAEDPATGDQLAVDQVRAHAAREARRRPNGSIAPRWPLPNVWLGVSVENQQWADIRIPALQATPAAVRFLSIEPLLAPVDLLPFMPPLDPYDSRETEDWNIDWVIVGGESGRGARPVHPRWVRSIRDQCELSNTSFLFKQWGEWRPGHLTDQGTRKGIHHFEDGLPVYRIGKKAAGRELDGRTWDEFPQAVTA